MPAVAAWPVTIYYDASCPLCREEMHALAAADRSGRLHLHDISSPAALDDACRGAGLDQATLSRRIHARDADGRWYVGVPVFEIAYRAAGLAGVARVFAHPRLRRLWDALYPWIADHRHVLSRLRLHRPFGWLVRMAASRAARRVARDTRACAEGSCSVR